MKDESEVFNNIMSSWSEEENPLYDTYLVKVENSEKMSKTAEKIKAIDGVDMVKYGEGMIDSLVSIFKIIEKVLIVIVISLIVVTAFLIVNTIKITIFSRQEEIEIKRLVGASNLSIKQPFVIEGLLIGLIGSIIPILITIYGYVALYDKTGGKIFSQFIKLIEPFPFVFIVSGVLALIGVVVGMIGSSSAVKKYLKI
jgi:cell division transport system permease protein